MLGLKWRRKKKGVKGPGSCRRQTWCKIKTLFLTNFWHLEISSVRFGRSGCSFSLSTEVISDYLSALPLPEWQLLMSKALSIASLLRLYARLIWEVVRVVQVSNGVSAAVSMNSVHQVFYCMYPPFSCQWGISMNFSWSMKRGSSRVALMVAHITMTR